MIICLCHRVSDRDIAREVASGCASFDELQFNTGVSTNCGCCRDSALEVFESQCRGCRPACEAPAHDSALACA